MNVQFLMAIDLGSQQMIIKILWQDSLFLNAFPSNFIEVSLGVFVQ